MKEIFKIKGVGYIIDYDILTKTATLRDNSGKTRKIDVRSAEFKEMIKNNNKNTDIVKKRCLSDDPDIAELARVIVNS